MSVHSKASGRAPRAGAVPAAPERSRKGEKDMAARRRIFVVIVAAGRSSRMRGAAGGNKVFAKICGRTVLSHGIERFLECGLAIDGIVVVAAPGEEGRSAAILSRALDGPFEKSPRVTAAAAATANRGAHAATPWCVATGGSERMLSVRNGLFGAEGLGAGDRDLVFVHDGARPNFPAEALSAMVEMVAIAPKASNRRPPAGRKPSGRGGFAGVTLAVPSHDTLCRVRADGSIAGYEDREAIWRVQTPQLFSLGALRGCFERALDGEKASGGARFTDETSMLFEMGYFVAVAPGAHENIKITTPSDLAAAGGSMGRKRNKPCGK